MGYRLKEIREQKGITQESLAAASGVSRATIAALEKGSERNTTSKTLAKLASALGVSLNDLFFERAV